jgi:hypothetical protein
MHSSSAWRRRFFAIAQNDKTLFFDVSNTLFETHRYGKAFYNIFPLKIIKIF